MSTSPLTEEKIREILKHEVDTALKIFESRISQSVNQEHSILSHRINDQSDKHEKISIQLNELNNMVNTDKVYVDRIEDLLQFQRKTTDQVNSHELRIGNLMKNLTNACYKYDKIFLDNLQIPGTIGDYCRFRNLREYIDVSLDHNV
jgi:hypothetical protein